MLGKLKMNVSVQVSLKNFVNQNILSTEYS